MCICYFPPKSWPLDKAQYFILPAQNTRRQWGKQRQNSSQTGAIIRAVTMERKLKVIWKRLQSTRWAPTRSLCQGPGAYTQASAHLCFWTDPSSWSLAAWHCQAALQAQRPHAKNEVDDFRIPWGLSMAQSAVMAIGCFFRLVGKRSWSEPFSW